MFFRFALQRGVSSISQGSDDTDTVAVFLGDDKPVTLGQAQAGSGRLSAKQRRYDHHGNCPQLWMTQSFMVEHGLEIAVL